MNDSRPRRPRVINTSAASRYTPIYSVHEAVKQAGMHERATVTAQRIVQEASAAAQLRLPPDEPLFLLARIRHADGVAFASERLWIPARIGEPLLAVDFGNTALYWELRDHCGVTVSGGHERWRAALATDALSRELGCPRGAPLIEIQRLSYRGDEPVEYRETSIAGEGFQLVRTFGDGVAPAFP